MAVIKKNASTDKYDYMDIAAILTAIDQLGFESKNPTKYEDGQLYVGTSMRKSGETQWSEPECFVRVDPEAPNNRNGKQQQVQIAITYARKTSLQLAFGLAATDNDAYVSVDSPVPVTPEQLQSIRELYGELHIAGTEWIESMSALLGHQIKDPTGISLEQADVIINGLKQQVTEQLTAKETDSETD